MENRSRTDLIPASQMRSNGMGISSLEMLDEPFKSSNIKLYMDYLCQDLNSIMEFQILSYTL